MVSLKVNMVSLNVNAIHLGDTVLQTMLICALHTYFFTIENDKI